MANILDRVALFAQNEGITIGSIEKTIGASKGVLSRALAQGTDVQAKWIKGIVENYPSLSPDWLLTGTGDMLRSSVTDKHEGTSKELRRMNEGTPTDDREMTERRPRELPVAKQVVNGGIPLIPIDAVAGFNGWDENGVAELDCAHYDVPDFEAAHADFLIRVSGSSMYPKYSSGDILACRKIDEITFIQWGKIYVIDSRQGAMVKRLFPIEGDSAMLLCKSDNPNYPPFELPKEEIRSISIVVGAIRLE